jgi:hypothetical protein
VVKGEWQAVLNTLTEHDFQDAFKNGRRAFKETPSRVMVVSRPEVNFNHIASPVPEIMDGSVNE